MADRRTVLTGALLLVCVVFVQGVWADELPEEPLPLGVQAPDFVVTTLEGSEISLASWHGHVVVVNYFITWYRDAARHLGIMESLATKYSPQGLRLISISLDEGQGGPGATKSFVGAHNVAHPVAADPQQMIAGRYGVRALPAIFIIGADGKISGYHEGYMEGDDGKIEELIAGALGAAVPEETTAETSADEAPADGEPVCKCFKQQEE